MKTGLKVWMIAVCVCLGVLAGCKKSPTPAPTPQPVQEIPQAVEKAVEPAKEAVAAAVEQTICPIMNKPIDKNIFVEYKGKKVYFCCQGCVAEFNKDPEKWVKDLPQFKP